MRWNLKPGSICKQLAVSASVLTMCLAPVAQGAAAENQKKLINQYLKETGLSTKKMTVGEYWRMVRHVYPAPLQKSLDLWVSINRNEMMPTIEASNIKDSTGSEQVRLTLSQGGQTTNLTFTGDEEKPMKVNGVSFTFKELMNYNSFNDLARKLSKEDTTLGKNLKKGTQSSISKNGVLTFEEYKNLSPRQKAEYMVRLRQTMAAAQRVFKAVYGEQAFNDLNKKYEWALRSVFGDEAQAAGSLTGKPCIVAGYLSIYGESGTCGGSSQGAADLSNKMQASGASCAGNGVACNPMVYGFQEGGSAYCVPRAKVKYATRECNEASPLEQGNSQAQVANKKRIIESYMKKVKGQDIDLKFNEEGKISEDQYKQISGYLDDLQKYINSAIAECGQAPLKNIQKTREDQVSACNEIKKRAFSLQLYAVNPEPPVPTVPAPVPPEPLPNPNGGTCDDQRSGSVPSADGKTCVCPEGSKVSDNEEDKGMCVVIEGGASKDLPGDKGTAQREVTPECGFWCKNKNWMIPVGVGLVGLGLFWWLFKDRSKAKSNSPVYVPPAPVPGTTTTTSTTPVPPVPPPPPPAPCPSTYTMVNGTCVPPVVVTPPVVTSEAGNKSDSPGRAGGVR